MIRFKLTQPQAARLPRLLRMEYTVRELAEELDLTPQDVRRACKKGCPHRTDHRQHLWIIGTDFAAWYTEVVVSRKRPLADHEIFCLGCRQPVTPTTSRTIIQKDGMTREASVCPHCGKIINRFRGKVQ